AHIGRPGLRDACLLVEVDHVGPVQDLAAHAALQGAGKIDRHEGAHVGPGGTDDVFEKSAEGPGAAAALVDDGGAASVDADIVGHQPEGGEPGETVDMQV